MPIKMGDTVNPDFVVDIGNTRIKWGQRSANALGNVVSLPADEPAAWHGQLQKWNILEKKTWVVSGVNPKTRTALIDWLRNHGQHVHLLDDPGQLPLRVKLDRPDHVGVDRLLNAVAANSRRPEGTPAVLIDAGSAVTVDWLDEEGAFCGGAIFPGLRLMTMALHSYTALLPLITINNSSPALPARSTPEAVEAGVFWTVVGGINAIVGHLAGKGQPMVFLAGGDAGLLAPRMERPALVWPEMTLEGIRLAVAKT
jgi:type III pantothenate kinase